MVDRRPCLGVLHESDDRTEATPGVERLLDRDALDVVDEHLTRTLQGCVCDFMLGSHYRYPLTSAGGLATDERGAPPRRHTLARATSISALLGAIRRRLRTAENAIGRSN